jgi:hypothetical protein
MANILFKSRAYLAQAAVLGGGDAAWSRMMIFTHYAE